MNSRRLVGALVLVGTAGAIVTQTQVNPSRRWTYYGGDKAATRYSPLDQITRENVKNLRVAWRRPAVDPQLKQTLPGSEPVELLPLDADHHRRDAVRAGRRRFARGVRPVDRPRRLDAGAVRTRR